jgi:hypothetical protein
MGFGKFINRNYKDYKGDRIKIVWRDNFQEITSACGTLLNAPSNREIKAYKYDQYLWFYIKLDIKNISIPLHKVKNLYLLKQNESVIHFIEISKRLKLCDDVINQIIEYSKEWYDITY